MGKGSKLTIVIFAVTLLMFVNGQSGNSVRPDEFSGDSEERFARSTEPNSNKRTENDLPDGLACPPEAKLEIENCYQEKKLPSGNSLDEVCGFRKQVAECIKNGLLKCTFTKKVTFGDLMKDPIETIRRQECVPKYISEAELKSLASGMASGSNTPYGGAAVWTIVTMIVLQVIADVATLAFI